MAEQVYAPRWLYGPPDGMQSVLVETQAHEDQMRAEGWMDSPAAFGTETHPAKPAQAVQRPGTGAVAPMSDETSTAVANLQGQLNTLATLAQRQDGDMSMLHGLIESLDARLTAMEAAMTAPAEPETSHATPPAESQGRGGRK